MFVWSDMLDSSAIIIIIMLKLLDSTTITERFVGE